MQIKTVFMAAAGVAFFVAALGFVGADDYRETVRQAVHYCDMVAAGYWPDYDGTARYCPEVYREAADVLGADYAARPVAVVRGSI